MKAQNLLLGLFASVFVACAAPLDPMLSSKEDPAPTPTVQQFFFPSPIKQITAAEVASFVLLENGTVWGFTTVPQPAIVPEKRAPFYGVKDQTPVQIEGLADVSSVAFRFRHGCALHKNGTVSCWGDNRHGQLGNGTQTSTPVPTLVKGLENAVQVDVGEEHSCALLENGQVACWGNRRNYFPTNPLKDGETNDQTPWLLDNVGPMKNLGLSRLHTCATTIAGSVQCWGNLWPDDNTVDITLAEQLDYRDFRLNTTPEQLVHGSCVLLTDGALACACQNEEASLLSAHIPCYWQNEPLASFGSGIVMADNQFAQVCAIFKDDRLRCKGLFNSPFHDVAPWEFSNVDASGWERIDGLKKPSAVSVGADTCVIDDDCVRCFGPWIGPKPESIGCYVPPPPPPR